MSRCQVIQIIGKSELELLARHNALHRPLVVPNKPSSQQRYIQKKVTCFTWLQDRTKPPQFFD